LSGLLVEIDVLYEGCVTNPRRWREQDFVDWAEGVSVGYDLDRTSAKMIRRALTMARKLAAFWLDHADLGGTDDWRSKVDIALGPRAWRPQLDLAEHLLATDPDPDVFAVVADLFPIVRNQPYLDGIRYEAWLEARPTP
jgi:hypothetical protein